MPKRRRLFGQDAKLSGPKSAFETVPLPVSKEKFSPEDERGVLWDNSRKD